MAYVPVRPKFLRGLTIPGKPSSPFPTSDQTIGKIFKVVYEFWGFCLNGGNDLLVPGGFATSHVTGSAINMPAGFENGASVLIASGTNGRTFNDTTLFSSSNPSAFTPYMQGKHITLWKSGSTSTEDSVYHITKWVNSSSLLLDPTTGGVVTSPSGSIPIFTSRQNINYRVTDFDAFNSMNTWFAGENMVLQFDDAATVNPGQAKSQFKILARNDGTTTTGRVCLHLSPSGSWDGTQFISESYAIITPESSNNSYSGWADVSWIHGLNVTREGLITIIADKTSFILHAGGPLFGSENPGYASILVAEVPERLYDQELDPNPICGGNWGNLGVSVGNFDGWGQGIRFFPSPYDTSNRRWASQVHSLFGTYFPAIAYQLPEFLGGISLAGSKAMRWEHFYNQQTDKFVFSDAILSCATMSGMSSSLGQYCLGRARLRSLRFCSAYHEQFMRVGDDDDRWIHVNSGIMWPWDHAIVPQHRLFRGS